MEIREQTLGNTAIIVLETKGLPLEPQPHLHSGCVFLVRLPNLPDLHLSSLEGKDAISLVDVDARIAGNMH